MDESMYRMTLFIAFCRTFGPHQSAASLHQTFLFSVPFRSAGDEFFFMHSINLNTSLKVLEITNYVSMENLTDWRQFFSSSSPRKYGKFFQVSMD